MGTICRIYERTGDGVKQVAEIRGRMVTGEKADFIRRSLQGYGFPDAPIEEVVNEFLLENPGWGLAFIPPEEDVGR